MERDRVIGLTEEAIKASQKAAVAGGFAVLGTVASCVNPIFVAPTVIFYEEFVRNFRIYERLKK